MSKVNLSGQGGVALLRMENGVTNAIGHRLLNDLDAALDAAHKDYRGMVLAGGDKFFSMGLDLPGLVDLDRKEMTEFMDKFSSVLWKLFCLPMPTVSAIKGHAVAGGTILALMTDYRFLAEGKTLMGLNEIKLGLTVPYLSQLCLYHTVPDHKAKDLIYAGEFVNPEQAAAWGLADRLCPKEECEALAMEKATALAGLDPEAFAALKAVRLEPLKERYQERSAAEKQIFLDFWFKEQTQELLKQAAAKF